MTDPALSKHAVRFEQPIKFSLDDRPNQENISVMTQAYTDKLEEIVRRHPEQWMWIHRRWKTRPDGEPGIYG